MADGLQLLQHPLGNFFYPAPHSTTAAAQRNLDSSYFAQAPTEIPPPSRSPAHVSTSTSSQIPRGMYGPSHGQSHGSRLNGVPSGRGMGPQMGYNYVQQMQQQNAHSHHTHPQQHHQGIQQDHNGQSASGSSMNHHGGFSSGILSSVTPFTPGSHQNGHAGGSRSGGQNQQYNDHWNAQLKSFDESKVAHHAMTEGHQPHYYARMRAAENRGIVPAPSQTNDAADVDGEVEDRGRPVIVEKSENRQDWQSLDFSGQGLYNISITLFDHYSFLEELYLASNNLTYLPPQIGQLRNLRHLDISHNKLTELPPELGMCTPLRQLLLYNNQIQTLPNELGALHFLEMLGMQGNPLNTEQKQKLVDEGTKALITSLKEQAPVPMPPLGREEIIVQEDVSSSLERIRVLSWNILCEKYATGTLYGYTPASALAWDYRKESIMAELRARAADVICLQETAMDAFETFFTPELGKEGYKGVFWPKTRVSHMSAKEMRQVDGCSIFYNATKYILLDKQLVDFRSSAINRPDMKATEDVFNRVMPKDQVAVYCFFESRKTGNRFIVVNAHLTWEWHLADVKAVQTGILMEIITKQSERYTRRPALPIEEKRLPHPSAESSDAEVDAEEFEPGPSQDYRNNTDIPLFVCGDYNSKADSSVYELLDKGRVSPDHPDLIGHSYGNFTRDGIEHPFSLRSSYAHLKGSKDDLSFTNYTPTFSGVIDYIWYTTNSLEAIKVLGAPDYEYLKRVPGFPNYHFPSDHIHIMAEFVFKAKKDKKSLSGGGGDGTAGSSRN